MQDQKGMEDSFVYFPGWQETFIIKDLRTAPAYVYAGWFL